MNFFFLNFLKKKFLFKIKYIFWFLKILNFFNLFNFFIYNILNN
jgi:hypothetical protein